MASPTQQKATSHPRQVAVKPSNTIHPEDIKAAAQHFDKWLQKITNGLVTLERIENVASGLPVVGNVIALVSVALDLKDLYDKQQRNIPVDALDYIFIGIDGIGLIPMPPSFAAMRLSLRPMLVEVRSELVAQGKVLVKDYAKATLGDALVSLLGEHLNATIIGDLERFLNEAETRLQEILKDTGHLLDQLLNHLGEGLKRVALGEADAAGIAKQADNEAHQAVNIFVHDPLKGILKGLASLGHTYEAAGLTVTNTAAKNLLSARQRAELVAAIDADMKKLGELCRKCMAELADPKAGAIAKLLTILISLVVAYRKKNGNGTRKPAAVKESHTSEAQHGHGQGELETTRFEAQAKSDGGCKECNSGTLGSISFARGAERLTHGDFSLPGLFALDWERMYRSDLSAYDAGPLGARWTSPFTTRLDIVRNGARPDTLRYHAADGRTHVWPQPKVGAFHYDAIENVTLVRVAQNCVAVSRGFEVKETYERHGEHYRLVNITLRNGAMVAIAYEHAGELNALTPSDLMTCHGEDIHAHVHTIVDEAGRITQMWLIDAGKPVRQLAAYRYDPAGDLIAATDENGGERAYTYEHHLITRYTDRTGRAMNLRWNGTAPTAKAVHEWADDGSYDTKLEWDPNIRLTYVTDAHGNETWYYYDILGYTYRIRHADGLSEWFFRDEAKNVTRHLHTDGSNEYFTYDERSNLVSHTRADGSTVHFAYDERDNPLKIRDAEGGLWKRDYDQKGNLSEETDPLGNTTRYEHNAAGLPVKITDAKGGVKQIAYTTTGQVASYTDCSGKTSRWNYDARGQLVGFTDAAGNQTRYRYEAGQLTAIERADGVIEYFERDAEGRLLAHMDGLLRRTEWSYTVAGRIGARKGANGQSIGYRWDKLGRLIGLTNENGAEMSFAYDPVGRLLEETGFDGSRTRYEYDAASGVLAHVVTGPNGERVVSPEFDAAGRLVARRAGLREANTDTVRYTQEERFAYNGNGQMILAENKASRLQWFHDAAGNVTREHQHYLCLKDPLVAVWRHEYDVLNQRVSTHRPDGHRVGVLSYGSGHVHGVLLDDAELVQIERDDLHREIERVQGNGLTQRQAYDALGRLTLQQLAASRDASGGTLGMTPGMTGASRAARLMKREYRYDGAGQLESIRDMRRGSLNYRYDPVGRLLSAVSALGEETFAFDPAGNLLDDPHTRRFAADAARGTPEYASRIQGRPALLDNLLKDYAGTHYSYDAYGNLTRRVQDGEKTEYRWDLLDRMVHSSSPSVSVDYYYDALGRRILKQSAAVGLGGSRAVLYGWDGDTLAWESGHAHGSGRIRTTHYVYEPGTFTPLALATREGYINLHAQPVYEGRYDIDRDPLWVTVPEPVAFAEIDYYQCDHLGTPQELTDSRGEIAWSAQYRAWGAAKEVISEAARKAGISNPLRFQGQYYDDETGLHYNRYRYYDPQTGRFVSRDPIGLAGGLNAFQYANNPVHWTDPLGLARTPHTGSCADAAARSALESVMAKSVRMNKEFGGLVFEKAGKYFATVPVPGTGRTFIPALALPQVPKGATIVGDYHTHGDYSVLGTSGEIVRTSDPSRDSFNSDDFSRRDKEITALATLKNKCHRSYLGTPSGKMKVYTVVGGTREL